MHLDPLTCEFRIARWLVEGYPSEVEVQLFRVTADPIKEVRIRTKCGAWVQTQPLCWHPRSGDGSEHTVKIGIKPQKAGTYPNGTLTVEVLLEHGCWEGVWELPSITTFVMPVKKPPRIEPRAFFGITVLGNFTIPACETVNDYLKHHFREATWEAIRQSGGNWRRAGARHTPGATVRVRTLPSLAERWVDVPGLRFSILSTPVSQRLWQTVRGESFGDFIGQRDPRIAKQKAAWLNPDMPVFGVTVEEAEDFCGRFHEWCLRHTEKSLDGQVRLPDEKEWREACGLKQAADGRTWIGWEAHCYNARLPGCPVAAASPRSVPLMLKDKSVKPLRGRIFGMLGDLGELCYRALQEEPAKYRALGGTYRPEHLASCAGLPHNVSARERREFFGIRPIWPH